MREQNLTQNQLAVRAGLSQSTISRLVRGKAHHYGVETLAAVVQVLGMPWPEFVQLSGLPESEIATLDDPLVIKQLRMLLDAGVSPLEQHERAELTRFLHRLVRAFG